MDKVGQNTIYKIKNDGDGPYSDSYGSQHQYALYKILDKLFVIERLFHKTVLSPKDS